MALIIALIVLAIIAVPFIAITALVNANKALKENFDLRKKLNELLYDKSSQEQKNKELKEQTKSTANKDPDKTVSIPFLSITRKPFAESFNFTKRFSLSTQKRCVCRFG